MRTWLITGCSSGFGLALTHLALSRGDRVIASSRNPSKTPDAVKEVKSNPNGRWIQLDVTSSQKEIDTVIKEAVTEFGGIDVLVNNAGYSTAGAMEEIPEELAKHQWETNYWGLLRVVKAVVPYMRVKKHGLIVNISSLLGLVTAPSCGHYQASKWAVEALSETLSKELAHFNIRVIIVEPGAFRTDFLVTGSNMRDTPIGQHYKGSPVEQTVDYMATANHNQPGDPEKGVIRIYEAVTGTGMLANDRMKNHLRLPLGTDCYEGITGQLESIKSNFVALKDVAVSTDF